MIQRASARRRDEEESAAAEAGGGSGADLSRITDRIQGPLGFVAVASGVLLVLAVLTVAKLGRTFLLPIVLAVVLNFLLSPVVRTLHRWGLPTVLGAGIVLLSMLGASGVAVYQLSEPATGWFQRAPDTMRRAEAKLRGVMQSMEQVKEAAEQAEKIADGGDESQASAEVTVEQQSFTRAIAGGAWTVVAGGAILFFLTFFMLASGDLFLRKLASVLPNFGQRRNAVRITRRVEREVSRYLATMGLINLILACAISGAMWLLEMPDPIVWGVMAGILNFIPYIGPLVGVLVTAAVAVVEFESTAHILAVPAAYLALNSIEGYLVTPFVMGRRLALNPVAILVGIIFWGWLWGIPGALLAVPLIAIMKIVFDHIAVLRPFGAFLGT